MAAVKVLLARALPLSLWYHWVLLFQVWQLPSWTFLCCQALATKEQAAELCPKAVLDAIRDDERKALEEDLTDPLRDCIATFEVRQPFGRSMEQVGGTGLHYAAILGSEEIVQTLLAKGFNPEAPTTSKGSWKPGSTPLMLAAFSGHSGAVKLLLPFREVETNYQNEGGYTSLMYAALGGKSEVAKVLLEVSGIDVNLADKYKKTALVHAVEEGHSKVIELLLRAPKIDVNCRDVDSKTPLIHAAWWGRPEVVELLLGDPNVEVNLYEKTKRTALMGAALKGHSRAVEILLKAKGLKVNLQDEDGKTALILATHRDESEIVKLLLNAPSIDVNIRDKDQMTALIHAAKEGNHQAVLALAGAPDLDTNFRNPKDGMSAMMYAVKRNDEEAIGALANLAGANCNLPNKEGLTPLMLAAEKGHAEAVVKLHECKGIEADAVREDGTTALMLAAAQNRDEVVKELVYRYRASNLDLQDQENMTALMIAAKKDFIQVVKELAQKDVSPAWLRRPVDRTLLNREGVNALVLAAENSHKSAVEFLQAFHSSGKEEETGLDESQRDVQKEIATAFLLASEKGKSEAASNLIKFSSIHGDDQDPDENGNNPLMLAIMRGQIGIVTLLLQNMTFNLTHRNKKEQTALGIAINEQSIATVELLLRADGSQVRWPVEGNLSALEVSLRAGQHIITKMLLTSGASVARDIDLEDLEVRRLGVWLGIKFSINDLVMFLAMETDDSWETISKPPRDCLGDLKDSCDSTLIMLARRWDMVHVLLDWQQPEVNKAEAEAALRAALLRGDMDLATTFLARGIGRDLDIEVDAIRTKDPALVKDRVKNWNRLHWCANSCDAHAMSLALMNTSWAFLKHLDDKGGQEGLTPIQLATNLETKCPGTLAVLQRLEATKQARLLQMYNGYVAGIFVAVECLRSLVFQLFFLRLQTLQQCGCCFMSVTPILVFLPGMFLAFCYPEDVEGAGDAVATGFIIIVSGAVLLIGVCITFMSSDVMERLQQIKKRGTDKLDRCWEKLDCCSSWLLVLVLFLQAMVLRGAGATSLLAGLTHAAASTMPLCMPSPRYSVLFLRVAPGSSILLALIFLTACSDSCKGFRLSEALSPAALQLILTSLALAWADMPGVVARIVERVGNVVELELVAKQANDKFTANKLILGRAAMAAHGIEQAIGLTPQQVAAGLQDPLAVMRQEVLASGDQNDLENFLYIVEGTSGLEQDYPSAVVTALQTGIYHGGELGPNDFDTGHEGRKLEDWMQVPEVVLAKLTEGEFVAVRFYTSSSFPKINGPLRQQVRPHPWAMVVFLLDRGIKKLRSVQAQVDARLFAGQTTLWRGMKNLEVDIAEFAHVGGTEMAPMSTTTNEEVARHYAKSKVPLVFKYVVGGLKTGVAIQFLSLYPKEEEFLYAPLTYLSLKNYYEDDGTTILVVEPVMS